MPVLSGHRGLSTELVCLVSMCMLTCSRLAYSNLINRSLRYDGSRKRGPSHSKVGLSLVTRCRFTQRSLSLVASVSAAFSDTTGTPFFTAFFSPGIDPEAFPAPQSLCHSKRLAEAKPTGDSSCLHSLI